MKLLRGITHALAEAVRDSRRDTPHIGAPRVVAFMCVMFTAHAILDPRGFVEDMHDAAEHAR